MAAPLRLTKKCRERDLADLERVLHRARKDERWTMRDAFVDSLTRAVNLFRIRLRLRAGRGAKPGRRAVR